MECCANFLSLSRRERLHASHGTGICVCSVDDCLQAVDHALMHEISKFWWSQQYSARLTLKGLFCRFPSNVPPVGIAVTMGWRSRDCFVIALMFLTTSSAVIDLGCKAAQLARLVDTSIATRVLVICMAKGGVCVGDG